MRVGRNGLRLCRRRCRRWVNLWWCLTYLLLGSLKFDQLFLIRGEFGKVLRAPARPAAASASYKKSLAAATGLTYVLLS